MNDSCCSAFDKEMMHQALSLAKQGRYNTSPNPKVGCIIVKDGQIIGRGFHPKSGEPHAEIFALQEAGEKAQGATVFVTLEPCSHYGKTPPCADALIKAKVAKVIAAIKDPNPQVAGSGFDKLTQAGITVEYGLLSQEARQLNRGFFSRIERQRPFVTVKSAMSLDGKTALNNGVSKWITSEQSRLDVQEWRACSCAILTGVNTILADNPLLNVRHIDTLRQPIRVIVDSHLRTPLDAKVITDGNSPTWLVTTNTDINQHQAYLQHQHVDVMVIKSKNGQVDLAQLMYELSLRGVGELLTETGATLNGALIDAGLVDELLIYQAPILLGNLARGAFNTGELHQLADASRWTIKQLQQIGSDIRIILAANGEK